MKLFIQPTLALASIISGFVFGFLLQKGKVTRFNTIVSQLLLKDFTVMKVIFTAIIFGGVGLFIMRQFGWIPQMHLSKTPLLFAVLGGGIFGIGMAVTGYCPGTALAALGSGAKDMIYAVLGMVFGTFVFNEFSSVLIPMMEKKDSFFQKTLSQLGSFSEGTIPLILLVGWIGVVCFEKHLKNRSRDIA